MKKMFNNVILNKVMLGLLGFLLSIMVTSAMNMNGSQVLAAEGDNVVATSKGYMTVEYSADNAKTMIGTSVPQQPTLDGYEDWLFAGWYKNATCTSPIRTTGESTGTCYAKFVPADILSVKCQVLSGTTSSSDKTNMRFTTSIDTNQYLNVGFVISRAGKNYTYETQQAYQRIEASATAGVVFEYSPKVIDTKSEAFVTYTIKNIPNTEGNKYFDTVFMAKPYWTTWDGVRVYGVTKYATVEDSYNDVVNIPVKVTASETLYKDADFNVVESEKTANETISAVRYNANENYAAVVMSGKTSLPSATKYTVIQDERVTTYIHRNLETKYTGEGTADRTWYDVYEDGEGNVTKDEFIVATSADLYGLSNIVMKQNDNFANKKVYVISDIVVNKGRATATGWSLVEEDGETAINGATDYPWLKIGTYGNPFAGTFDGQGHTISGICYSGTESYYGLFGKTNNSTITNFKLKNSSFVYTGTSLAYFGGIAGSASGTFENIKSEAYVSSTHQHNGGVIGHANGNIDIIGCWYSGTLTLNGTNAKNGGGIVGMIGDGIKVSMAQCLYNGVISGDATGTEGYGGVCGHLYETGELSISNSLVLGSVSSVGNNFIGTIVGYIYGNTKTAVLNVDNTYIKEDVCARAIRVRGGANIYYESDVMTTTNIDSSAYKRTLKIEDIVGYKAWYDTHSILNLDFEEYWCLAKDTTPQPRKLAEKGDVLTTLGGEGTEDNPWVITDTEELIAFSDMATEYDFRGKYVNVGTEEKAGTLTIILNEGATVDEVKANAVAVGGTGSWLPIGNSTMKFAGNFNGNHNTIRGLYISTAESYQGLFGFVNGANIKNIVLQSSYLENTATSSNAYLGGIIGFGNGTFENLKCDAQIISGAARNGGLIGCVDNTTIITGCWYSGDMTLGAAGTHSGGIVGMINSGVSVTMSQCLYDGTIVGSGTTTAAGYGGLCGRINGTAYLQIVDSLAIGSVATTTGSNWIGTIVGFMDGTSETAKATVTVEDTYSSYTNTNQDFLVRTRSNALYICGDEELALGNGGVRCNAYANTVVKDDIKGYDAWYNNNSVLGLNFDKYWCLVEDATPQLRSFTSEADILPMLEGEGTESSPWLITKAEDLSNLAIIAKSLDFNGKYVSIGTTEDSGKMTIAINQGDTVEEVKTNAVSETGSGNWTPIGTSALPFAGTFNGNGNVISGLYYSGSDTYVGLFGNISNTATIKNLKLTNSYMQNTSTASTYMGSVVGCTHGTVDTVMSDAVIEAKGQAIGGLAGGISYTETTTGTIKFTNCWFDGNITLTTSTGRQSGGIVGLVDETNASIVIEHCLNTGVLSATRTDAYTQLGGICGLVNRYGSFKISDTLNAEIVQNSSASTGSLIGKVSPTTAYVLQNVYGVTGLAKNEVTYEHVLVGTGGTVSTDSVNYSVVDVEDAKGTDVWYNNTLTLDFVNYWDPVTDGTPELKSFSTNAVGIWEGQGTESSPWIITNKADLELLSSLSQKYSFDNKHFQIGTDEQVGTLTIVVNEGTLDEIKASSPANWVPIGTNSNGKRFAGTFDGNGNTISGLYYNGDGTGVGLFGTTGNNAEVKNLKIANSYFESSATGNVYIGSVAGIGYGTFKDIKSKAEVVCYGSYGGGLVGSLWTLASGYADFDDCWFDGTLRVEGTIAQKCGGILGGTKAKDRVDMTNCLNSGTILISKSNTTAINVGGFCGMVESNLNITNSLNAKSITINRGNVSAILGNVATGTVTLNNVYAIEGDGPDQAYNDKGCYGVLGTTYNPVFSVQNQGWDEWRKSTHEELRGNNSLTYAVGLFGTDTHWIVGDLYPVLNMAGETYDSIPQMSVSTTENTSTKLTGDGNFVTTVTGTTKTNYDDYLSLVTAADFVKVADNVIDESVYSTTYTRDELVLCVTYFSKESKTSISYYEGAISEHLVYDAEDVEANEKDAVTTMSMMELFAYGNSFVIQLKNGHFLISDGGMECELPYLLDYLDELTPGDAIPVVEGWFISHAHEDHCGALNAFYDDTTLASRIYVEGVYYSSPNDEVVLNNSGCESKDYVLSRVVKGILRNSNGEPTKLYRPQTGQRYYFNDTTIDILLAQEQLSVEKTEANITYRSNLNSSSTVCLFTSEAGTNNAQTCLFSGDLQETGFDNLFANYSDTLFSTLDFFTLNHHGFNISAKMASKITAKTVLLTVKGDTPVRCATAIKTLTDKAQESMAWGNGTVVFTLPHTAGASSYTVLTSKDVTGWIYNVGEEREEQPNLYVGTDGTTSEDWE